MPQHRSAMKRVRQNAKRRLRNRFQLSRIRTMIKRLETTTDREAADALFRETKAQLDRLEAKGILPKNKVAREKSRLQKRVSSLS